MAKKIEKIRVDMNAGRLQEDLEKYRLKALELGATQAAVIKAGDIPVDERVTLKCQIPRCFGYGAGAHCPPNTLKPGELRELLKKFQFAVFFIKEVPSEVIVRDKTTIKERVAAYQEVFKIVNDVESLAFHDGHCGGRLRVSAFLPNPCCGLPPPGAFWRFWPRSRAPGAAAPPCCWSASPF